MFTYLFDIFCVVTDVKWIREAFFYLLRFIFWVIDSEKLKRFPFLLHLW